MKSLKYKAVLLDLDGTLIDSLGDIAGHMNRVREHYGFAPRPSSELVPFIGHGVDTLAVNAIPELGLDKLDEIVHRFRASYAADPHVDGKVFEGVPQALTELRELGAVLAIATNKGSHVAERCLEHYLPGHEFAVIAGPDRVSQRKPHPAHLLEVLKEISIEPKDACYVGDHDVDRDVAVAAGVDFFAASYGFGGVDVPDSEKLANFPELVTKITV